MGPGPSDVPERILQAMARPTIGHLDPAFIGLMDEIKTLLQYAFQTSYALTFPVSAPGSAGMETCFVNLLEPGDTAIVCINGVFGGRMKENIERCGAQAVVVEDAWGEPVTPEKVEMALKAHPEASLLAFVHAETSTGALSDAKTLSELGHAHDCLVLADTVTSLGGVPLVVEAWRLDAVYSGTQKCLSAPPGLSPVSFSPQALEKIQQRRSRVQSWFLDLNLILGYWGQGARRAYHHTAPVNSLYALHEALRMLQEEGLEQAWERHRHWHGVLREGLEELGLKMVVPEAARLPQLNTVWIPEGVEDAAVRQRLLQEFGLEIGAGLGSLAGKVWRIGLMGYSCREENVVRCLQALRQVLV
ncbi:alanine--glyoxylate aminotransferase [bacterium (Candidatus Blackallbacteria) CG17_big_fil_post_rev_8_21_14_2_50_48_46]|uniref:Alanine--glyoxylate aminotransferase n=1 Tax=bacterium (Candidatus Blackallbacteria) CG17_big_fil_post_rev_8_21_14_2_50_48_46 TaxID=2014261 RepID=A0A2M7G6T2_9BACT|nr:MAG: alanine--glyoxylate aminotransferase [bacterium (Candidatus Blackallbacteria) CG18_big_fil_WC_8_21_14_2_50_49_26]PIW17745.1 MAG: alanine--glyoxylate aminotransferase [bacterium (Candidatus Blackallbacteria) CG17_big_fil_post_rev_8_21_14_2_50_48_46]PIW47544.1 MAG: alanine--glyoxylate aminotransferase [bacterium (Candidatus Blackallbacteria) CG13_big_fil_rev_8_21_14_2_50_49_14]